MVNTQMSIVRLALLRIARNLSSELSSSWIDLQFLRVQPLPEWKFLHGMARSGKKSTSTNESLPPAPDGPEPDGDESIPMQLPMAVQCFPLGSTVENAEYSSRTDSNSATPQMAMASQEARIQPPRLQP